MSGLGILFMRRGIQSHPTAGSDYIRFRDAAVAEICIENFSTDGVGVTKDDAAAVTSLGGKFKGNTSITSFDELEYFGVKNLAASEFNGCSALQSINLSKVTSIGASAFVGCAALQSVNTDFYEVASIGASAFDGCENLFIEEINAVNLVTLGNYAFRNVSVYRWANTGKLATFNNYVSTYGLVTEMLFGDYFTANKLPRSYYENNTTLRKLRLPQSVVSIDAYALKNASNLEIIEGLDHVTSILTEGVAGVALKGELGLPMLETVDNGGLSNIDGITRAYLPSFVSTQQQIFASCDNLEYAEFGSNATSFGSRYSFNGCANLKVVIVRASTPPTYNNTMFNGAPNALVYVPDEAVDAYKASWTAYASRIFPLSSYTE